jgi:hypothetical protein
MPPIKAAFRRKDVFVAAKIRCNYDKTKLFPLKVVIDMDFLAVLVVL